MPAIRSRGFLSPYSVLIVFACIVLIGCCLTPIANEFRRKSKQREGIHSIPDDRLSTLLASGREQKGAKNKDYRVWYAAGLTVLRGEDIYPPGGEQFPFIYPPFAAVVLAPLAAMGRIMMVAGLCLVNSAACIAISLMSVYLATGKALRQHPMLYAIPALVVAPWINDNFLIGQPNLFLLFCMMLAFVSLRQRREAPAGAMIALATAIKAFPLMGIVYLIYRRRWKATASMLAFLLFFLVILPSPFRGFGRNLAELRNWANGMLFHYDKEELGQRSGRAYAWSNGSLLALTNRLLRPVDPFPKGKHNQDDDSTQDEPSVSEKSRGPQRINIANLNFHYVNAIFVLTSLMLCLGYVLVMPPRARSTPQTEAIEQAMLLVLMLIFSPLLYGYYFVWLWFPLTIVLHRLLIAQPRERRGLWIWFGLLLLTLFFNAPQFKLARALGSNVWSALLMLGGLAWMLRNPPRPAENSRDEGMLDAALTPPSAH